MIGPILRIAAASMAARTLRSAIADALARTLLILGAGAGALVAVICFSRAAFTLLERHMDPAEAWVVVGTFYGVTGGILYLAAARRRG